MPRLLPLVALLAFVAPASAAEPTPRERGDLAIRARFVLKKYCHECHHGGEKTRGRFVALDHTKLVAAGPHPVPFVVPKDPTASQIVHFIEDGSMPPGSRPRPTKGEIDALKVWIAAGSPSYPAAFDDAGTARVMLDDLARQKTEDGPHLRYFSFAHLVRDDADPPDLKKAEDELYRALAVGGVALPKGQPPAELVDGTATLYRFDLRTPGWDNRELFFRPAAKGMSETVHPLAAYDLLLLEHPHAPDPDPRLADYFAKAKLARPVPFLRADWVAGTLLAKDSPLAEDLRSLTALSKALREKGNPQLGDESGMPCGTRSRPFAGRNPVPPGQAGSLGAWYSGDIAPEKPPFDLTAEVIDLEGKPLKTVEAGQPFRLRVGAEKNVRFVLLMITADGTVRVQPTNKDGIIDADEVVLTPTVEAPFKITDIVTGEKQATEYFVLLAAETQLPPVAVLRSRHAATQACGDAKQFPVYRFLFDPDKKSPDGFDPARVVRRVIPVTVTAKPD